jgi:hypothetical protein
MRHTQKQNISPAGSPRSSIGQFMSRDCEPRARKKKKKKKTPPGAEYGREERRTSTTPIHAHTPVQQVKDLGEAGRGVKEQRGERGRVQDPILLCLAITRRQERPVQAFLRVLVHHNPLNEHTHRCPFLLSAPRRGKGSQIQKGESSPFHQLPLFE